MTKVAIKYNLSDRGLAKICAKLNIPRPSRGYWAKIKAGQNIKKPKLPKYEGSEPRSLRKPSVLSEPNLLRKPKQRSEPMHLRKPLMPSEPLFLRKPKPLSEPEKTREP